MYLMVTDLNDIKVIKDEATLKTELLTLCFKWTHCTTYCGDAEEYKELFEDCWNEHNFGDIAHVYQYNGNDFTFYLSKISDTIVLKRIF